MSADQSSKEALERLELKVAYLERANQDLSDVVYRQQQALDALTARLQRVIGRMEELSAPTTTWTPDQEKPPHY